MDLDATTRLAGWLVERGVRVVMVTHSSWDQHTELERDLKKNCDITAGPVAALIQDLKQVEPVEGAIQSAADVAVSAGRAARITP